MCGINGFLGFGEKNYAQNKMRIQVMNEKIYHRGPDGMGFYADSCAALGMTRLSIIDLSTGMQPISNEDGRYQIVFNGEIYNYRELRSELKAKGHVFRTESDTETILHAYEEYGRDCLKKIFGMFALAIYDTYEHKLFLARDRIGEKPLYYTKRANEFLFASELKSILALREGKHEIDRTALAQYLTLSYIPAPLTILKNVQKLEPGYCLTVTQEGILDKYCYWNVVYDRTNQILDYNECKRKLRETMYHAVEQCMVSDVPIGAFLSGGIDSTIITSIMSEISPTPINTYTIGFKEKSYDESNLAALTARKLGTKHEILYLDYADAFENIFCILKNMDEPFGDSSIIPTYIVSKMARQSVKVILTGDAGDEQFGGYEKYLIGYYSGIYNKIPKLIREGVIEKLAFAIPDNSKLTRKVRKVISNAGENVFEQRRNLMCLALNYSGINQLMCDVPIDPLIMIRKHYDRYSECTDEIDRAFYTDLKVVLEGDMLCKVDRGSMLASLETRVPMLYPEVVELAARIPACYKISGNRKKIILKDTFSDLIHPTLLQAKKRGFAVPMAEWLRKELKDELIHTLNDQRIEAEGLFRVEKVHSLMADHFSGKHNNSGILWSLYVFEKWYQNYFAVKG